MKRKLIWGIIITIITVCGYILSYSVFLPVFEFLGFSFVGDVFYEPAEWIRFRSDTVYYYTEEGYQKVSLGLKRLFKESSYKIRILPSSRYYFPTHRRNVYWDDNGDKLKEDHYLKEKRNGLVFFKDRLCLHYKSDIGSGKMEEWYDNGIKAVDVTMDNGFFIGLQSFFYDNGKKACEINYKPDLIQEKAWNKDGEIVYEITLKNGIADGKYHVNYVELERILNNNFFKGYLFLRLKCFDADGIHSYSKCFERLFEFLTVPLSVTKAVNAFDGNFVKGVPIGTHNYFYENGKKACSVTYENGVLHGEVLVWDTNDTLILKRIYENGKPK